MMMDFTWGMRESQNPGLLCWATRRTEVSFIEKRKIIRTQFVRKDQNLVLKNKLSMPIRHPRLCHQAVEWWLLTDKMCNQGKSLLAWVTWEESSLLPEKPLYVFQVWPRVITKVFYGKCHGVKLPSPHQARYRDGALPSLGSCSQGIRLLWLVIHFTEEWFWLMTSLRFLFKTAFFPSSRQLNQYLLVEQGRWKHQLLVLPHKRSIKLGKL